VGGFKGSSQHLDERRTMARSVEGGWGWHDDVGD
jgi:hypothetical protein